jgi:hypothetical protein
MIALVIISFISLNNNSNDSGNWTYDQNEYPKEEYWLDDLPVSHESAYEVRQFFEDSDTNHDGVLKGDEISSFDYKIKHSQYTFNGPYGYN